MEPSHSMIDRAASYYGVLSQNGGQHPQHLIPRDRAAFNEADHHPHMVHDRRRFLTSAGFGHDRGPGSCLSRTPAALIEGDLLLFPHVRIAVIGHTAPNRFALAMGRPAAEGTTHLPALPHVAGMGQKENTAMPPPSPASTQLRLGPQHRSQNKIIFHHQGSCGALAIPIRPKLKMLRDPDCKSPKLWLRILTFDKMSPSYRIGTPVSRT
jgi:hypothetical protein